MYQFACMQVKLDGSHLSTAECKVKVINTHICMYTCDTNFQLWQLESTDIDVKPLGIVELLFLYHSRNFKSVCHFLWFYGCSNVQNWICELCTFLKIWSHIRAHTHISLRIHICTHATCTCTHMHTCTCIHMYVHMHAHIPHMHSMIHLYACTYADIHQRMHK